MSCNIVWIYCNLFNYSFLWHLKYFHFVAIINNPVMNAFVYKPLSGFLIFSLGYILRYGIMVSIGVGILEGLENSKYRILYRNIVYIYVFSVLKIFFWLW